MRALSHRPSSAVVRKPALEPSSALLAVATAPQALCSCARHSTCRGSMPADTISDQHYLTSEFAKCTDAELRDVTRWLWHRRDIHLPRRHEVVVAPS